MKKKIIEEKILSDSDTANISPGLTPTYYVPPVISSEKFWILDLVDAA